MPREPFLLGSQGNEGTVVSLPVGRPTGIHDWLHVPIATPLCLHGDRPVVFKYLQFIANLEGTAIEKFHIRCGSQLIARENLDPPIYQWPGRLHVEHYVHPEPADPEVTTIGGGVDLCIYVCWDVLGSKIEVLGAGARFDA